MLPLYQNIKSFDGKTKILSFFSIGPPRNLKTGYQVKSFGIFKMV